MNIPKFINPGMKANNATNIFSEVNNVYSYENIDSNVTTYWSN